MRGEKKAAYQKEYRRTHREQRLATGRAWYRTHGANKRANNRAWCRAHRQERLVYQREWCRRKKQERVDEAWRVSRCRTKGTLTKHVYHREWYQIYCSIGTPLYNALHMQQVGS